MMLAWFIIGSVLAFAALCAIAAAYWLNWEDNYDVGGNVEFRDINKKIAAFGSLAIVGSLLWPIVLVGALPAFVLYGLWQALKMGFKKKSSETVD